MPRNICILTARGLEAQRKLGTPLRSNFHSKTGGSSVNLLQMGVPLVHIVLPLYQKSLPSASTVLLPVIPPENLPLCLLQKSLPFVLLVDELLADGSQPFG
eukprot:13604149-Heterocapsa_arctica.AAC.1